MTSYVIADYTFLLINIACALCANEDRRRRLPRRLSREKSPRGERPASGTPAPCVHTSTGSSVRSWPRQTHLSRERDSPRALPPLQRAPGPLLHAGLAATPSIRAPLPTIGSNQFQQRRQRWRRSCDNGSLTCPHLPFSRSRTASKKERRRFALAMRSALILDL